MNEAILSHIQMGIYLHGCPDAGVTDGFGEGGQIEVRIIFVLDVIVSYIGMPLRYNYDKPEKPRISRVFGYQARFFILFQPEKSSREVVIS